MVVELTAFRVTAVADVEAALEVDVDVDIDVEHENDDDELLVEFDSELEALGLKSDVRTAAAERMFKKISSENLAALLFSPQFQN